MMKAKVILFGSLMLAACGSDSDSKDESKGITLGTTEYIAQDGSVAVTDGTTSGDGTLVAKSPLGSIASGKHFAVKGTLSEGGQIAITAYGTNQNTGGLTITFANSDDALKVSATQGDNTVDISETFAGQSATAVDYGIDVHNDETPAHVVIWSGAATSTPIFNSEENGDMPGNGTGEFFGVQLKSSTLSQLAVSEPKFEGEDE